jgi:hypothetical protein
VFDKIDGFGITSGGFDVKLVEEKRLNVDIVQQRMQNISTTARLMTRSCSTWKSWTHGTTARHSLI